MNKICAADNSEATVEWEEFGVEDSDTGGDSDIN